MIAPDGKARLDHYFSRQPAVGSWTGRVDAAALDALWAALDRAGFPAVPEFRPVGGATLRRLAVEHNGSAAEALVDWHQRAAARGLRRGVRPPGRRGQAAERRGRALPD